MSRKVTLQQKRDWVTAYKKRVKSYKNANLEVPPVAKIARDLGLDSNRLRRYLDQAGVKYELVKNGKVRSNSVLQQAV